MGCGATTRTEEDLHEMAASIRVVGVVGAGQMGSGIAQVAAAANMQVIMADLDDAALSRGIRAISSSLSKFVKKQLLSQVTPLPPPDAITVFGLLPPGS